MKAFHLKVIFVSRKEGGVSQLGKHKVWDEHNSEKEARLTLLKSYIKSGYRVLKIKRGEKAYG